MKDKVLNNLKLECNNVLEHIKKDFSSIYGNRVSPSLIEDIKVNVFDSVMPLKALASILITDNGQGFLINVWDTSTVSAISKAILESQLGINPNVEGNSIRIKFPPMTEETRNKKVKIVKQKSEDAKISLRNHRHTAIDTIKKAEKDKLITEDELHDMKEKIDNIIKDYEKKIDEMLKLKEKELLEI